MTDDETFMARAIALSEHTALVESAGGAFGAVIVRDGQIVGEGANRVVAENDPTWHAEMAAIRDACKKEGSFKLPGSTLYTSAEPCPMCMAAAYWAGISRIFYASTNEDALRHGNFDDSMIYEEVRKPADQRKIPIRQIMRAEAIEVWERYEAKADRVPY
ncbi:nucleoside deaminase [Methylobacterium platani]|uniref:tRNA-specific adenosine deaminase n=2 Tax=Methylobacterium platani TaxID=427683 RepID=A0A179SF85_9HYPH|nr:nucleoside deaminase [Methylobacterium platani]KMO17045.1 dCMP deaminase [Methylobacterium platani JCM 14648]OAS26537.1 tRNA-specific adenosine deaminase [Methylobacterium platani]